MQGSYEPGDEAACLKRGLQALEGEENCLGRGDELRGGVSLSGMWERGFEVGSVTKREQKECIPCERKELSLFGAS